MPVRAGSWRGQINIKNKILVFQLDKTHKEAVCGT